MIETVDPLFKKSKKKTEIGKKIKKQNWNFQKPNFESCQ